MLDEPSGAVLLKFDELYVNFELSSLLRWAWTFGDIRLKNPFIRLERKCAGARESRGARRTGYRHQTRRKILAGTTGEPTRVSAAQMEEAKLDDDGVVAMTLKVDVADAKP